MTQYGGTASGGNVFSIGTRAALALETCIRSPAAPTVRAHGSLILSGETLYGMTFSGGTAGHGTIFSLGTDGSYKNLGSFSYANGSSPSGSLILSGSTLYG